MVALRNWHKYAGLLSAVIVLLLAVTGFFLDHKNWSFLYTTTIPNTFLPASVHDKSKGLNEAYWKDPLSNTVLVGSRRGLFYSENNNSFVPLFSRQILALREDPATHTLYAATDDGLYRSSDRRSWYPFTLQGLHINALSLHDDKLVCVIDKKELVMVEMASGKILERTTVHIDAQELEHPVSLSRFVRDFHYGRGLFDGVWSLLINDMTAAIMTLLSLSGLLIWWFIKKVRAKEKRYAKRLKPTITLHSNTILLPFIIPMILFSLTGIVLDHSQFFNRYIKSVMLPHAVLPPVYDTLSEDIWSVDYDGAHYRVGNRYGIYISDDLRHWYFENRGLAYKMKRLGDTLLVSGMGAPNRIYSEEKGWKVLPKTPHMFKDVWQEHEEYNYFSTHRPDLALPQFKSTTLYTLLLSLHDGTFFASWWVYVNDIAAILLLVLMLTGTLRLARKKKWLKR